MTGPEHYREAERLLGAVVQTHDGAEYGTNLAQAQVHATIALAAATALNDADIGMVYREREAWCEVAETRETPS